MVPEDPWDDDDTSSIRARPDHGIGRGNFDDPGGGRDGDKTVLEEKRRHARDCDDLEPAGDVHVRTGRRRVSGSVADGFR